MFFGGIYETFIILQLIFRPVKAILYILVCLKWGDWRNWRKYYPTILYVIIWDLIFNLLLIITPYGHSIIRSLSILSVIY